MSPNPQQVGRAGELFVAAEINRRGGYAVVFSGNMPKIDILASNLDQTRNVAIQVKTRRSGTWHSRKSVGRETPEEADPTRFWVLVDLPGPGTLPGYFVVPEWYMLTLIRKVSDVYIRDHPNVTSDHFGITTDLVEKWRDRWDVLALWPRLAFESSVR